MIVSSMTFLLVLHAFSRPLEVYAYELNKVQLKETYGQYYQQDVVYNSNLNQESTNNSVLTETIRKQPVIFDQESQYDPSLEVIELRTENSKTYQLKNGSFAKEIFFETIHKEEDGQLQEIDNTLEEIEVNEYGNKNGLYDFHVDQNIMTMSDQNGHSLQFINENANLSVFEVKENVLLYSEAYKNIDFEYRLGGNQVYTHFYINGPIDQKQILFTVRYGDLNLKEYEDYFDFVDDEDNVVFSYVKPIMSDQSKENRKVILGYTKQENAIELVIEMDINWLNSTERTYPVLLKASANETKDISISSSYIRSLQPNVTSRYYDLFVGYDDGTLNTLTNFGIARTYIHVSDLGLGDNKIIENATLQLYKKISFPQQWNTIEISKTSSFVDPASVKWSNKPANLSSVSVTSVRGTPGMQDFDVTSYIQDIYEGVNNTIELKATNESYSYFANVFYGESGAVLPRITVTYRDNFDVDPDLDINVMDMEMRVYSVLNESFFGLSFDGIAKPNSEIFFHLVEMGKDTVIQTESSIGSVDKYFTSPIFITNPLSLVQFYTKNNSNYTTDYILQERIPNLDIPYEYVMVVRNEGINSTLDLRSDAIIKYKVKLGDNLQTIASYYGAKIEEIKRDNNLTSDTVYEDQILLVRMKKDNPKVSQDVYTPPLKIQEYKAIYVNRGPRCVGSCDIMDPVNSNTGNYFYESIDFTITDFEQLDLRRYYNSTGPQISGIFGNGNTSDVESYIAYDKEGNLLYFKGDGKIFKINKINEDYIPDIQDPIEINVVDNQIRIKNRDENKTYLFNSYGYLEQIVFSNGYKIQVNYDEFGLIQTVAYGNKIVQFNYNENNLVKEIVLPNGNKVQYKYDEKRNLIEFMDAVGKSESYHYDVYLTHITDKEGHLTAMNEYDLEGRVIQQTDSNGHVTTLSYVEGITTVTRADGTIEEYQYNHNYKTTQLKINDEVYHQFIYDNLGNRTSKIDSKGEETKYFYQGHQVIKIEYSDQTTEEFQYSEHGEVSFYKDRNNEIKMNAYEGNDLKEATKENGEMITFTYNHEHQAIKEASNMGWSKEYHYQGYQIVMIEYSHGLIQYFDYDEVGNVIKESDNQGKNTTYLYNGRNEIIQKNFVDGSNEKWQYDGNGNVVQYQNRIGSIITYTYDKNNNWIETRQGSLVKTRMYDCLNRLLGETDERGNTIAYQYDVFGNRIEETDIYGNKTFYDYDQDQNMIKIIDEMGNSEENTYVNGNLIRHKSKEGLVTTYEYNLFNQRTTKTDPTGLKTTYEYQDHVLVKLADSTGLIIEYEYDDFGRERKQTTRYADGVVVESSRVYDGYGNVISETMDGVKTTYTYDVYHRLIETEDALGNRYKKEYDFDNRVIKEMDALGNFTTTTYDARGNVLATVDKNGNITSRTYNSNGVLTSEKDALGYVTTYHYNEKGQLVEMVDPYLVKTTFSYDQFSQTVEIKIHDLIVERYTYDQQGREVVKETLTEKISTVYDQWGHAIQTTDELSGLVTSIKYDEHSNVIENSDSQGLVVSFVYDDQRLIQTTDAYGRVEELIYDARGNIVEIKNFDKTTIKHSYDNKNNLIETISELGVVTKYMYNEIGQKISQDENGKRTEYKYNGNGFLIEERNINNSSFTINNYDKNGNLIEVIDAMGFSFKSKYDQKNQKIQLIDPLGNETSFVYDAKGNIVKEINALGYTKQTKYNEFGLKVMEVDERGFFVEYRYDEQLRVIEVIDKLGSLSSFSYDDQNKLSEVKNPNGYSTAYEYDLYGRETKKIASNGLVYQKTYDLLGNIIETRQGDLITENRYDKQGNLIEVKINDVIQNQYSYNEYNQLITKVDANGNESNYQYHQNGQIEYANENGFVTEKIYDVDGYVIKQIENGTLVIENEYDFNHQLIEIKTNGKTTEKREIDANGNLVGLVVNGLPMKLDYDELNRNIEIKVIASEDDSWITFEKYAYDETGNKITSEDAYGNSEKTMYDGNNNVISQINKKGVENKFEYDAMNNLIKVQDGKERYVVYTYDASNNPVSKKINDKYATYHYDINNNLIKETDEYGTTRQYEVDSFGRVIQVTKPDGTTIQMTYDNLGNKLTENKNTYMYDSRNNLLTSRNQEGTVTYTYDEFNQMVTSVDPYGKEVKYTYNEDNQLMKKEYNGIVIEYRYDQDGYLESVYQEGEEIARYEYSNRKDVEKLIQGNMITSKKYDDAGRVIEQTTTQEGIVIYKATYAYDVHGNLVEEIVNGKENIYIYNEYDELLESNKYVDEQLVMTKYQFDIYGNQQVISSSEGNKTYLYNEQNQLESIQTEKGTIKYTYNKNGNLAMKTIEDGQKEKYSYNEFEQLIEVDKGQYVYSYVYDGEQERIGQTKKDTQDYHYDVWYTTRKNLNLVSKEEITDTFDSLREQVAKKEKNKNSCIVTGKKKEDVTYYKKDIETRYLLDRNAEYTEVLNDGTVDYIYGKNLLEDSYGLVVNGWNNSIVARIEESGIKIVSYNDYGATKNIKSGYSYNGEMKDETGLIYLRARYYDPEVARFIQIDNNYKGEKQKANTQNRYNYVLGNPYKYVDRTGEFAITLSTVVVFVVAFVGAAYLTTPTGKEATRNVLNAVVNAGADVMDRVGERLKSIGDVLVDSLDDVFQNPLTQGNGTGLVNAMVISNVISQPCLPSYDGTGTLKSPQLPQLPEVDWEQLGSYAATIAGGATLLQQIKNILKEKNPSKNQKRNTARHHIVPQTARGAAVSLKNGWLELDTARAVLESVDITVRGFSDVRNLAEVWVVIHASLHTGLYYDLVSRTFPSSIAGNYPVIVAILDGWRRILTSF